MSAFEIYCIVKLDDIIFFFGILNFVLGMLLIIWSIILLMVQDDKYDLKCFLGAFPVKLFNILLVAFIVSISAFTLIPSTKQIAAILTIPPIVNNEKVQDLPGSLLDLGIEWLEELRPEKRGE